VHTRLGELPALWPDSVVFFADLYAIFFGEPEKTRQLKDSVRGFFGYGGRLIPMLNLLYRGGNNRLLLQETPDADAIAYFRNTLGLSLPETMVLDHRDHPTLHEGLMCRPDLWAALRDHPADRVDGYVTDSHLEGIAKRLGIPVLNGHQASRDANDKRLLNDFLHTAGLPQFDGGEVSPGPDLVRALTDLARGGYRRAVIRSALGASGFGVATVALDPSGTEPPHLPRHLGTEERLLVQGWIEPGVCGITEVASPSVQFFIGPDAVTVFDLTGQLLKDASIHEGNVSPPTDLGADPAIHAEVLAQTGEVTRWVAATGYMGTGSIDFLVYRQHGTLRVCVCEVNARVTGATYPSLLARRFRPGGAWLMRNFGFEPRFSTSKILHALNRAKRLYRPGAAGGVLPINFIHDRDHRVVKSQLLFLADTPDACHDEMLRCLDPLPVRGTYERD